MGDKEPIPYMHKCGGTAVTRDREEPPDPDRYGNRFVPIECAACGKRDALLLHKHGDPTVSEGWERVQTAREP